METPVIPEEILVEPGDHVKKGSLLAKINTQLTKSVLAQGISTSKDTETAEREAALYEQYGKVYGLTEREIAQVFGSSPSALSSQPENNSFIPSEIVSPMDGIITQVDLASGVLCSSNRAAIVMNSVENGKVTIHIKQNDIDSIQEGTPAYIQGEGLGGRTYQAIGKKNFSVCTKKI